MDVRTTQMHEDGLLLPGLDGANPLGFLAAIGVLALLAQEDIHAKLGWLMHGGTWKPTITGNAYLENSSSKDALTSQLSSILAKTSDEPFTSSSKLPFSSTALAAAFDNALGSSTGNTRRTADILTSFGSDSIHDQKGVFQATDLCMLRSGDSAGNGLPAYAQELRAKCGEEELRRSLFNHWDYRDEGSSLRWDPVEDRRYALDWHNPTSSQGIKNKPMMIGANVLALEALAVYPSVPVGNQLSTTGFVNPQKKNRTFFTWPIWTPSVCYGELRSLLAYIKLREPSRDRNALTQRGVVAVFRSERIAPNQYYKNFSPADSV